MADPTLDFEKGLDEIRRRIEDMRTTAEQCNIDLEQEILAMEEQHVAMARRVFASLTPWQEVQMARHVARPQTRDYINLTFNDFLELHGDRLFGDDGAIVTGFARVGEHRVLLVGQHKGRTVEERHRCMFGYPLPEGYRKALAKMQLAEKFGIPIVTLIDTKGAYPDIGSEERGVAMAIAVNLRDMSRLRVPIITVVIGEGGSGGALGIGVGDRALMLQHAYYATIAPEGCAAILWKSAAKAPEAAAALKLTSRDLLHFGFIDEVIPEPLGGAHKDPEAMGRSLRQALIRHLDELAQEDVASLVEKRYDRLRRIGDWEEATDERLAEVLSPAVVMASAESVQS